MPIFTVAELINVAIKDEETGIKFYNALAESTRNEKLKERISAISRQEANHAARFKEMLDDVGEYKPPKRYEEEYGAYFKALLDARPFLSPDQAAEKARSVGNDAEALKIAIDLEKETLLFLNNLKEFLPSTHEEYINEIIAEERGHLTELAGLRDNL